MAEGRTFSKQQAANRVKQGMTPAISVIMPVHNRADLVGRAVESVLSQSFSDFELVIVDDGSSDDLDGALARFDDPRIRRVRLESNQGSNKARNIGIASTNAPILTFLDSDDLYLPHKLSSVLRYFEQFPEADVRVDLFIKLASPESKMPYLVMRNPDTDTGADFTRALFLRKLYKATSAISVRRLAAVRAGLFSEGVQQRQDFDFLIRLSETARCTSSPEICWIKTWSRTRITSPARFVAATLVLVERHPQFLKNREYRPGLARDLVRNSAWLAKRGHGRTVLGNFAMVMRKFGLIETVRLYGEGVAQALRDMVRRRALCGGESLSPEVRNLVEEVRSRGSTRS